MAQLLEIGYFNSFLLAGGVTGTSGSANEGHHAPGRWHVEEARV